MRTKEDRGGGVKMSCSECTSFTDDPNLIIQIHSCGVHSSRINLKIILNDSFLETATPHYMNKILV